LLTTGHEALVPQPARSRLVGWQFRCLLWGAERTWQGIPV